MKIERFKRGGFLIWRLIFDTREEQTKFDEELHHLDELHAVYYHDSAYTRGHIELSKYIL